MSIIKKIFGTKSVIKPEEVDKGKTTSDIKDIVRWSPEYIDLLTAPLVAGSNYLELFKSVPEVFWPIDYIASRISGAHFELKRANDDSIVWTNKPINALLSKPNCIMGWRELIYQHHIYKLCTGNAFFRAVLPDTVTDSDTRIWRWCSNYWSLPADKIRIQPTNMGSSIPLFGIASREDIISYYRLEMALRGAMDIPVMQIWHDRDGSAEYESGTMFLK